MPSTDVPQKGTWTVDKHPQKSSKFTTKFKWNKSIKYIEGYLAQMSQGRSVLKMPNNPSKSESLNGGSEKKFRQNHKCNQRPLGVTNQDPRAWTNITPKLLVFGETDELVHQSHIL